jgi:hypothetical protein
MLNYPETNKALNQLPEEVLEEGVPEELLLLMKQQEAIRKATIQALGEEVKKKRDLAIKGRKTSGIEDIWREDEEYYHGVDDANRANNPWVKTSSTSGGLYRDTGANDNATRCTAFFNITRQFCDSASARIGDIILPAGDWNFHIKPTPVPQLLEYKDSEEQVVDIEGQPIIDQKTGEPKTEGDFASDELAEAEKRAKKAETRIKDYLTECRYHAEARKVIDNAVILGTGVLRGPSPKKARSKAVTENNGGKSLVIEEKIVPESVSVKPYNFFPDPNCGENIHDGSYVFERDFITSKKLRDLIGVPGYIHDSIEQVIDEGPLKKNYDGFIKIPGTQTLDTDLFEIWYFYGLINPKYLVAMEAHVPEEKKSEDTIPAVVVVVNDTPIKAFVDPRETGEFPYDVFPYQRLAGHWAGIGVARQGRTAQDMLNASARAMMDNAGLSSGPMTIIDQEKLRPADGVWDIRARKVWIAKKGADIRSVADAIMAINIPMMQVELQNMVQLAQKFYEDATGISFLLQGQQGSAPDTVGGMELLHRNASALLRRIARVFDERITEPHIRRYYDWLLVYGEDDDEKGDMQIEAIGSTALVEREIQNMFMSNVILVAAANPIYGLDPEKTMAEIIKANRFEPSKFQLDEEKKKQLAESTQGNPAVEAAKIRAEAQIQSANISAQATMERARVDTDRDTVYVQSQTARDQANAQNRAEELRLKREIAQSEREMRMLDYANKRNISLDKAKAELSQTVMKLRVQKELSRMSGKTPQVDTPPNEPAGRAENGKAYQQ